MNSESWHWNDEQELIHNSESDVVADIHIARHGPLIAAAPDLLEALADCLMLLTDAAVDVRRIDHRHAKRIDEAIKQHSRLIARAEGKQE